MDNPKSCPVCDKNFAKLNSVYRHLRNVHGIGTERFLQRKIKCSPSGSLFTEYKTLRNHLEDDHSQKMELQEAKLSLKGGIQTTKSCPVCKKSFSKLNSVYRHLRMVHGVRTESFIQGKIKCPLCGLLFTNYTTLRNHLEGVHSQKMERQEIKLPSKEDFEAWKTTLEQETNYRYVCQGGPWKAVLQGRKTYYTCHRSGFFNSSGTTRQLKRQGSSKINCTCPSTLEVTENTFTGAVTLIHWKTHVGHTADFEHVHLTSEDRAMIAGKIIQGMSYEEIVEDIKAVTCGEEFKRLHFFTRKDYHNIKKTYGMMHKSIVDSINQWVAEMNELGNDSPVLYYKCPGISDVENTFEQSGLYLIVMTKLQQRLVHVMGTERLCIDADHTSSGFNFELITLLAMDDSGQGWPIAFCITNDTEESGLAYFFQKVKEKCDVISCSVFTTIDHAAYLSAWCSVMGTPQKCLLCSWHVEKMWQQKLGELKIASEKQQQILNVLSNLMMEPSQENFEISMVKFVATYSSDPDVRDFVDYFHSRYVNTIFMWAFCHRIRWDVISNAYLESFHKAIEYVYTEGKKNWRLDTCLTSLITLSRDKIFTYLTNLKEVKTLDIVRDINQAHNKAVKSGSNSVVLTDKNTWEVNISERKVRVIQLGIKCTCAFKCSSCNVCVHMLSCTCADHLVKLNICEHIHACVLKDLSVPGPSKCADHNTDLVLEADERKDDETTRPKQPHPRTESLDIMEKKLKLISSCMSSVTNENINACNQYLDLVITELRKDVPLVMPTVLGNTKQNFLAISGQQAPNAPPVIQSPTIVPTQGNVYILLVTPP